MSRTLAVLTLILCTLFWGIAFLFQKQAMAHMGPLTFTAIRYLIGTIVVAPLALREYRVRRPERGPLAFRHWGQLVVLVLSFFAGVWAQQAAMQTSSVTSGGFLTSLYVIFTPLAAFLLFRHRPHPIVYVGAPLALLGIYLLTGADLSRFTLADGLLVICALSWAVQIAVLAPLVQETKLPITMSAACFAATGVLALLGVPIFEHPTLEAIGNGWIDILYTGIFSTAIAFTLQAIGQQYVPAANAAIILSSESLFAALAGAVVLGERLPPLGYLGAAVIFCSILLVELVPQLWRSTSQPAG